MATQVRRFRAVISVCGGAPISIVRQYIEQQQTPH
jgi:hypothetical protein